MDTELTTIEAPDIQLNHCSVKEHCTALHRLQRLPFWWYQQTSRLYGNPFIPFQDLNGIWWYQVKPGFCWPVDLYAAIDPSRTCPSWSRSFIGYQFLAPDSAQANCSLVVNTLQNLPEYGPARLSKDRRKKIRKGLKLCQIEILTKPEDLVFEACRAIWADLSRRTGWKRPLARSIFHNQWRLLLQCPGTTILLARDAETGQIVGFYIVKVIGDTAYGDTISVPTDKLTLNVNDALRYSFLINAGKIPGIRRACAAIRSTLSGLETFKSSIGFTAEPYPAHLVLRPGVTVLMKTLFRKQYDRMTGVFENQ
jgi:hypothetical protein